MWDEYYDYGYPEYPDPPADTSTAVQDPPADQTAIDNLDLSWTDLGDGTWINELTGEVQDAQGNSLGYADPIGTNAAGDPLFSDPNSGLQTRDGNPFAGDILTPTDVNVSPAGGGFWSGVGNFFSHLFGGGGPGPGAAGGGGGGSMGGGGSGSGSGSQQQQQQSQAQQQIQQLQAQLAAAQRANANAGVTAAIRQQIAALGGSSGPSMTQILLITAAVGGAIYLATRNNRSA